MLPDVEQDYDFSNWEVAEEDEPQMGGFAVPKSIQSQILDFLREDAGYYVASKFIPLRSLNDVLDDAFPEMSEKEKATYFASTTQCVATRHGFYTHRNTVYHTHFGLTDRQMNVWQDGMEIHE